MDEASALRGLPEWEELRRQIVERAIHFNDALRFDFRELLSDAHYMRMAGRLMWRSIKHFDPDVLIGPGMGAAPLLFSIAHAALDDGCRLHTLMVRDQRKGHNRRRWVEGRRQPDHSRAVVVDDFMEGGSAISLVDTALEADGHVVDIRAAMVFFDMWQPLGSRQLSMHRFPVVSLFRRHDIGLTRDCFDAQPPAMKGSYPPFIEAPLWHRFDLNANRQHVYKSSPVIADGAVFVADDSSRVWRHNAACGDIEWSHESLQQSAKGIVQRLQYADGSVVFGSYDGTITRLNAADGRVCWRWRQDSSIHATPELDLARGRVFINTEQWNDGAPCGHLQAIDWKTGRQLWRYPLSYWPPATVAYGPEFNVVIAPCNDLTVSCVDADTGVLRWRIRTSGLIRGRPAISGNRVLWAAEDGVLSCIDIPSGEVLWERRYGRPLAHQFLLVRAGCAFVLDGKWHLLVFDIQSGALRWLSRLRSPGCGSPIEYGRYLVVLSRGGELAVFDPVKEIKVWESAIGGQYYQPPALSEGLLAAASNDEGLKVFSISPFYEQHQ
ncbi:outer membrane protein assembly factor BamB family protein [Paraburkholderia caledonica]|uniref:Outer membrane protein assembly factor BamB/orotate phosphoribosyltransferase n=1 Tax=Paraburkholderia caledonica TaxID=134536 RepID=A0AB73IN41_9BURK|nr:outer membrane protein assembly factor BamB/orotate phosphoribosyltransferase [Paraburkholderia caledonica]